MNLLKSVSKGIEKQIEIDKLELIIERRIKQYDKEVQEVIDTPNLYLTNEEILIREEEIINRCLEKYDGEACPYMKKQCEPTWRDGGGNNLEVRKRMLLRELNSRRGKLAAGLAQKKADIDTRMAIVKDFILKFETNVMLKLPLSSTALKTELDSFIPDVNVLLAPYDFATLNTISNGQLVNQHTEMVEKITKRNQELIEDEINRLRVNTIQKAATAIHLEIRNVIELSLNELKTNLPPYLTPQDVASFDAELLYKGDQASKAFAKADYEFRN